MGGVGSAELGTPQNSVGLFHFESDLTNSSTAPSGKLSIEAYVMGYTTTAKFGSAALDLYNSDSYLSSTTLAPVLNSSEFTIDYWVKVNTTNTTTGIDLNTFSLLTNSSRSICRLGIAHYTTSGNGYMRIYIASTSASWVTRTAFAVTYNSSYNHIAIIRKDNVIKIYVNGEYVNQFAFAYTSNTGLTYSSYIGSSDDITDGSYGYCSNLLDELRISNIARWTSNFTPPTEPYA